MSVRMMSAVFDRYPAGGGEMLLALCLADHSSDDGQNIFPTVKAMAKLTRQSERSVQYQLRKMVDSGWLILVRKGYGTAGGRGHAAHYRINPDWIKGAEIAPFSDPERVQSATERVQSTTLKGAIAVAPYPSVTIKEPPCPNSRSDAGLQGSKPEVKVADPEDLRLAEWMFGLVLQLQPRHKPPNFGKWANEIRLMRDRDMRSRRGIADLFRWANGHSFWQSNILSPAKLRERWDQLEIRRKADAAMPGAAATKPPPVIDRQCAFREHGLRCVHKGVTSTGNHASSPWYCRPHLERVEQGDLGEGMPVGEGLFSEVMG